MTVWVCQKCAQAKVKALFPKTPKNRKRASYCKLCMTVCVKASMLKLKREVFNHYGGCCSLCSEYDKDVLTIDHINQDGAKHRKEHKLEPGQKTWLWLKKNKYPKEFRVLCFNCNTKEYRKYVRSKKASENRREIEAHQNEI